MIEDAQHDRAARGRDGERRQRQQERAQRQHHVGNLQDRGNWSFDPDPDVFQRNVQTAIDFFTLMRPPAPGQRVTRSKPPQTMPDVNSFFDVQL